MGFTVKFIFGLYKTKTTTNIRIKIQISHSTTTSLLLFVDSHFFRIFSTKIYEIYWLCSFTTKKTKRTLYKQ